MNKKIIFLIILISSSVFGEGSFAGTNIINSAELKYKINGVEDKSVSNIVTDKVDQIISLDIICNTSTALTVKAGDKDKALPFILKNTGNKIDVFNLSSESLIAPPEVENIRIYLDNGDNLFNNLDTLITSISLDPEKQVKLFLVSDIPINISSNKSINGIKAISSTGGSGIKGTIYDLGSFFAVDGEKGGIDKSFCEYEINDINLVLYQTATLSSEKLYTGTIIHYKIKLSLENDGLLSNIIFKNKIPEGTVFVSETIKLNGAILNDNHLISGIININIPDMTGKDNNYVEFDVKVQ